MGSQTLNLQGSKEYGKSVFSHTFPINSKFTFPNNLGIAWISASPKIFEKPINLKWLCFPMPFPNYGNPLSLCFWDCKDFCFTQNIFLILFQYYENSLFPCFRNCMDFCFTQTHKFKMLVFSQVFPVLWKSTFPMFWELHGFLLHPNNFKNM